MPGEMNTLYFKYAVEVAKTGSISQAAEKEIDIVLQEANSLQFIENKFLYS